MSWLKDLWNEFVNFLYRLVLTVFDAIKEVFLWLFDSMSNLVITVLDSSSSVLSTFDITQYASMIPPETREVMALIGFTDAITMVISCGLIRLLMQLIPFVRLGS